MNNETFPGDIISDLTKWLDRREADAIKGPRQSGKTTILARAILVESKDADGFAQAINTLLSDCLLRRSMSLKAKKLASKFSWKRTAQQTLALCKRCVLGRS